MHIECIFFILTRCRIIEYYNRKHDNNKNTFHLPPHQQPRRVTASPHLSLRSRRHQSEAGEGQTRRGKGVWLRTGSDVGHDWTGVPLGRPRFVEGGSLYKVPVPLLEGRQEFGASWRICVSVWCQTGSWQKSGVVVEYDTAV